MSNLSQQEKNDIIATRIMGYEKNERGNWLYTDKHGERVEDYRTFNPCNSLDDCYLAESKMREPLRFRYICAMTAINDSDNPEDNYFFFLHATPEQKVNAMLKALDIS